MNKSLLNLLGVIFLTAAPCVHSAAQDIAVDEKPDTVRFTVKQEKQLKEIRFSAKNKILGDTLGFSQKTRNERTRDQWLEEMPIRHDLFRKDWFVFATGGVHAFFGDYSNLGSFGGTISPEVSVGAGYWFNPIVAIKAEFIRSMSRGYSRYLSGNHGFGYGDILQNKYGVFYRKMRVSWWDASCSVIINLTRIANNYEGYRSRGNMNQVLLSLGAGCVHFLNYRQENGTGYDWSGHAELQYSRFFERSKRVSLDIKLRWLFYSTNFDYESKRRDRLIDRMDCNLGIHAGITCYLGTFKKKKQLNNILTNDGYDFSTSITKQQCGSPNRVNLSPTYENNQYQQ